MLEQQALTATGLGGGAAARRPRHGGRNNRGYAGKRPAGHLKHFRGFRSLKAGKRHA